MHSGIFIAFTLILFRCHAQESGSPLSPPAQGEQIQNLPPVFLSLKEAEKILGEPAYLADSTVTRKDGLIQYNLTFTATISEEKTGKTGNLYFMLEQFDDVSAAQSSYASIKKANENHEGISVLHDLGDEAYFHSDSQNFYFILVRKGKAMFRMKVNKITGHTSLEDFHQIAARIAGSI